MTTGAYCFYDKSTDNIFKKKFGPLYNGYAVEIGKLAPEGWRIPTSADWDTLISYLANNGYSCDGTIGSTVIAKALAAKKDWTSSTDGCAIGNDLSQNNRSGFSALPSGCGNPARFGNYSEFCAWWGIADNKSGLFARFSYYYMPILWGGSTDNRDGFSIRLVRD